MSAIHSEGVKKRLQGRILQNWVVVGGIAWESRDSMEQLLSSIGWVHCGCVIIIQSNTFNRWMNRVFHTQPNPQSPPQKQRLKTLQSLPIAKEQMASYVSSLDIKLNSAMLQQLSTLKVKHLQLGGNLSALQAERSRILKESTRREEELRDSFQLYLMRDIDRFKDHREFFKKHFSTFSSKLNEAIEKRDKLKLCAEELRAKWYEMKKGLIKQQTRKTILPMISQQLSNFKTMRTENTMKTMKTVHTTEATERSIRISTDMADSMSPILMRMGGSQPILGSRIGLPIKSMSQSNKKTQRKRNILTLKQLLEERYHDKDVSKRTEFEDVLFYRRNFCRLMEFLEGGESR